MKNLSVILASVALVAVAAFLVVNLARVKIAMTQGSPTVGAFPTSSALPTAVVVVLKDPPVAALAYPDYYAMPGQEISFDASKTSSRSSTIVRYEWDYDGDGIFDASTATPIAKHSYPTKSDYVMRLRATDANGSSAATSAGVHIGAGPRDGELAAPTDVTAVVVSTSTDGISTVQVSWEAASPAVFRWGVTINGYPAGMVDAAKRTTPITEVHRDQDVEIGVVGFTKEGMIGRAATVVVPAIGR